jgi:hypothetical protein
MQARHVVSGDDVAAAAGAQDAWHVVHGYVAGGGHPSLSTPGPSTCLQMELSTSPSPTCACTSTLMQLAHTPNAGGASAAPAHAHCTP